MKFAIVEGTHFILYDETHLTSCDHDSGSDKPSLVIPGIPLYLMEDILQGSDLSDDDILGMFESVHLPDNHLFIENAVLQLAEEQEHTSFSTKTEVHTAFVTKKAVNDELNDSDICSSSVDVYRIEDTMSSVSVVEKLPSNKVLCTVEGVGSILIFDFFKNMFDQILFLPVLKNEEYNIEYESLKMLVLCSLSHALVTNGVAMCGRMHPQQLLNSKLDYSLSTVDEKASRTFHYTDNSPNESKYSSKSDNFPSIVANQVVLEKLSEGLESRILSETESTRYSQQSCSIVKEAAATTKNILYQFIRNSSGLLQGQNKPSLQNAFIPVFSRQYNPIEGNLDVKPENFDNIESPLQVTQVSWKSERTNDISIIVEIGLKAQTIAAINSPEDSKDSNVTHFQEVFLSFSGVTELHHQGFETTSGCIPLLLDGQCAIVRAKLSIPFSFIATLASTFLEFVVKAHWKEFRSTIPYYESKKSLKKLEQGVLVGKMKLPIEDFILGTPEMKQVLETNPPTPLACFDYRKPRIIHISQPSQGYASLERFKNRVENSKSTSDYIDINQETGTIEVYSDTFESRATLVKLLVDNFSDDITVMENDAQSKKFHRSLLAAISTELKVMKKHTKFPPASTEKNILEELLHTQIITDEISSMAMCDM